jgi:alpha-glucosidase
MAHRMNQLVLQAGLGLTMVACALPAWPAEPAAAAAARPWWQHAVFYEIYPRSFADTDGDGIGDLNGIRSRLDYLQDLGVDALWITPCYPSPQVDFGYDVSDYQDIDPMYGTLADFDRLVAGAKSRGIRIVMDFVLNHTSDQHPWFVDSQSSRSAAHRDWYIWRDGRARGVAPNNWISLFGHSAWQWDERTGQHYYHFFYPQQPDLNWRNPAVANTMIDITRWWYRRGVAGFRLDAVDTVFEDPNLTDNPVLPGLNRYGDPNMRNLHNQKLPEDLQVLYRLRTVADEFDAVLIGETNPESVAELEAYYGTTARPGLQLPMDYLLAKVGTLSATEFRRQILAVEATGRWPVYFIGNHDIPRPASRYGDAQHNDAVAKLLAGMVLTLRGTPILYYGDELGMRNNDPERREDVLDPIGRLGWPKEKGRDGERTPMQWSPELQAGFTSGKPWRPVPASYRTHNVETELADPGSVLRFYRDMLHLRRGEPALLDGRLQMLAPDDPDVLAYVRHVEANAVVVLLNMSAQRRAVVLNLESLGLPGKAETLLTTAHSRAKVVDTAHVELEPFSVYVGRLVR